MRKPRLFDAERALPRMSWSTTNLYNLWSRSLGPHSSNNHSGNLTTFTNTSEPLFRQRWQSKKLVRAYHGDWIPEKKFTKWYLPERLPDPMARRKIQIVGADEVAEQSGNAVKKDGSSSTTTGRKLTKKERLQAAIQGNRLSEKNAAWARPGQGVKPTYASVGGGGIATDETIAGGGLAPISSLMFAELERRLDVVVFRCCFASSIHSARQLVVHGKVKLNGLKESNPNVRLNPGDMISIEPEAMNILRTPPQVLAERAKAQEEMQLQWEKAVEKATKEGSEPPAKPAALEPPSTEVSKEDPPFVLPPYASPFIFIPPYIEPSFATCSAIYLRHPTARPGYSEVPTPYDADGEIVRFAWEWYQRHRPRIRGWKKDLRERMEKGKSGWNGI